MLSLELLQELEALVLPVSRVVAGCLSDSIVSATSLARELLRFLHLKAALNDFGRTYVMSPPSLIDAAWKALLCETPAMADVYSALGVPIIHRSSLLPSDSDSHAQRLRATFSAALHAAEHAAPVLSCAYALPPLDTLV